MFGGGVALAWDTFSDTLTSSAFYAGSPFGFEHDKHFTPLASSIPSMDELSTITDTPLPCIEFY